MYNIKLVEGVNMLSLNKTIFISAIIIVSTLFGSISALAKENTNNSESLKHTGYGFTKVVNLEFEKAVEKVKEELKKEGFGVLTEVNVKETLKKKLDVDFRPYVILGACNPPFAYKALQAEEQIGLLLPCNVIVYVNSNNETVVAVIDPIASMQKVNNDKLSEIAETIQNKLKKVISNL
jgi:uncharacterized protein (DUF302 family)